MEWPGEGCFIYTAEDGISVCFMDLVRGIYLGPIIGAVLGGPKAARTIAQRSTEVGPANMGIAMRHPPPNHRGGSPARVNGVVRCGRSPEHSLAGAGYGRWSAMRLPE